MESKRKTDNKQKLEELLNNFPVAWGKYLSDSIAAANNASSDEEFDRIVADRLTESRFMVEYLLDSGVTFHRTGHWVCGYDNQDNWTCSECGFPVMAVDDWRDPYEAEIDFCEKCGAQMIKTERKKSTTPHINVGA